MENINWEFAVQIGILISLIFLIIKIYDVAVMVEAHFEQDHEYQRNHSEYLANLPTYAMLYKLKNDEPVYED
jgi:MFS superfamily sulfate permease-like transporter|tara:strand:+ start:302 stop:517 length:216 start_codon:yes stop_codon:yes gene_type:complete